MVKYVAVALLAACAAPASPAPLAAQQPTAATVLKTLAVKGRAPKTGYDRTKFPHWDGAPCNTRQQILTRDLTRRTMRGCKVTAGTLTDPYTGSVVAFSSSQSWQVQIDHVVSLSDAWQKGAQKWSLASRETFANDPLNLLATDAATNVAKSDHDAASWLPKRDRCGFVSRQVAVKAKYGLWVTAAEKTSMAAVLKACPNQRIPR